MKSIMLALRFITIICITQIVEATVPDFADKTATHSETKDLEWLPSNDFAIAVFSEKQGGNLLLKTRYRKKGNVRIKRKINAEQLAEFLDAIVENKFPKLDTLHMHLGSLSNEFVSPVINAITNKMFSNLKELEIFFQHVPSENQEILKNLQNGILSATFPVLERLFFYQVDDDFVEEIGQKKRYGRGFPVLNYISLEKGVLSREFRIQMAQDYGIEVDGEFFYLTHHKIATPAERQAEMETSWEIDRLVKAWEKKRMKIDGPTLSYLDI